jgi:hypothetical protein
MTNFSHVKITAQTAIDQTYYKKVQRRNWLATSIIGSLSAVFAVSQTAYNTRGDNHRGLVILLSILGSVLITIAIIAWVSVKTNKLAQLQVGELWRGRALDFDGATNKGGALVINESEMRFIPFTTMGVGGNEFTIPIVSIAAIEFGGFTWGGPYGWRFQMVTIKLLDGSARMIKIKNYTEFYDFFNQQINQQS